MCDAWLIRLPREDVGEIVGGDTGVELPVAIAPGQGHRAVPVGDRIAAGEVGAAAGDAHRVDAVLCEGRERRCVDHRRLRDRSHLVVEDHAAGEILDPPAGVSRRRRRPRHDDDRRPVLAADGARETVDDRDLRIGIAAGPIENEPGRLLRLLDGAREDDLAVRPVGNADVGEDEIIGALVGDRDRRATVGGDPARSLEARGIDDHLPAAGRELLELDGHHGVARHARLEDVLHDRIGKAIAVDGRWRVEAVGERRHERPERQIVRRDGVAVGVDHERLAEKLHRRRRRRPERLEGGGSRIVDDRPRVGGRQRPRRLRCHGAGTGDEDVEGVVDPRLDRAVLDHTG